MCWVQTFISNEGNSYHVGFGVRHIKEVVASLQGKSLELFSTKFVDAQLHIDLNRCAMSPTQNVSFFCTIEVYDPNAMSQPPMSQQFKFEMNDNDQVNKQENNVHVEQGNGFDMEDEDIKGDISGQEDEIYENDLGDMEAQVTEEDMYHDIPYQHTYAPDSEDDGLEESDEDGFIVKES